MSLSHRLELRLAEQDLRLIREKAAEAGFSVSTYVRQAVLQPGTFTVNDQKAGQNDPSDWMPLTAGKATQLEASGDWIKLRLSRTTKAAIKGKAKAAGLSLSAYVRRAALERDVIHRFDQAAARQLKRIGVNLNQAVMLMHQGDFSAEVRESFRRCLTALEMELGRP